MSGRYYCIERGYKIGLNDRDRMALTVMTALFSSHTARHSHFYQHNRLILHVFTVLLNSLSTITH